MTVRQLTVYLPPADVLWTFFDFVFAIVMPVACIPLWVLLSQMGPGQIAMEVRAYWWFATIEVAVYCLWLALRRLQSSRTSALFAGCLAAGSAFAAWIAVWLFQRLVGTHGIDWSLVWFSVVVSAIPAGTAVAFARGAWRAWRLARQDPSISAPAGACVAAIAILVAVFFWPVTSSAAIEWSIGRVDRGDSRALDEAAALLKRMPWASTDALVSEWETRMRHGGDATQIEKLFELVTGSDLQNEL